ncbi:MAG: DUF1761 domain-containing protein [Candidatus Obscuribacterales bacterium]|nr:DUF1761 domain-containing protein [Steroidobacteraceae bacterium]
MESINWLAALVAAASGFAVGGIWYGPLFGKAWMAATGMTEEKAKSGNMAMIYGLTYLLNVIAAISLAMLLGPESTWQSGLFYGAITGVTFVSTALGITYLFEQRPLSQFLVNAGYQTVNFATMGVILGAWH